MTEVLGYAFMQRALLAGTVIGVVCAVIGVYVVLKGMSFIGAGIAHASFGGVALGFLLGVNPVLAAVVFCLATGWGIGLTARRTRIREDTAVGIFFASTMAVGILVIGLMQGYTVDLFGYLFGSILAVGRADLEITLAFGAAVLALVAVFYKELMFVTFDSEMAAVTGVPAEKIYFLLISLVALTVVISIKVVGTVLVSALLVTPAAAAYQLTEKFGRMMAAAVALGVGSTVGGLLLSYKLDTASGATIVLVSTAMFLTAAALSPRRRRKKQAGTAASGPVPGSAAPRH